VLSALGEVPLFIGSTVLTAFNDNAAITFLASQVPSFAKGVDGASVLQYAVVAGAVTGGGLTVIANAPNPAGQSLLSKYFGNEGVSPLKLLLGALFPTLIMAFMFICLPH
jgi:Na+/H+ antiporter NhaD/arsenite permease-like protein